MSSTEVSTKPQDFSGSDECAVPKGPVASEIYRLFDTKSLHPDMEQDASLGMTRRALVFE